MSVASPTTRFALISRAKAGHTDVNIPLALYTVDIKFMIIEYCIEYYLRYTEYYLLFIIRFVDTLSFTCDRRNF